MKGRAHVEQGVSYRFDRNRCTTLIGEQNSHITALLSWTQLDVRVSPAQHVIATVSFDPAHRSREHFGVSPRPQACRAWSRAAGAPLSRIASRYGKASEPRNCAGR